MTELKPLQASWSVDQLELENKDLFIKVYREELQELLDEINVFGAPHLGSFDLVSRVVSADGLALINDQDEARMRAIFKAWRLLNPERGLHFLRFYLRLLFTDNFDLYQLWQKKSLPYTENMKRREAIIAAGEAETDYFLTSRVRVDLNDDENFVPDQIIRALRTTLAARFVLEVRLSRFMASSGAMAGVASSWNFIHFRGECI